jgi:hypothetical protein
MTELRTAAESDESGVTPPAMPTSSATATGDCVPGASIVGAREQLLTLRALPVLSRLRSAERKPDEIIPPILGSICRLVVISCVVTWAVNVSAPTGVTSPGLTSKEANAPDAGIFTPERPSARRASAHTSKYRRNLAGHDPLLFLRGTHAGVREELLRRRAGRWAFGAASALLLGTPILVAAARGFVG